MDDGCYWCNTCREYVFEGVKNNHAGHELYGKTEEIEAILPFGGECGGG